MSILVRRSNLVLPATDAAAIAAAWSHNADAVTLDLHGGMPAHQMDTARQSLPAAIAAVGRGGADVFVWVNAAAFYADLNAAVCAGLCGIILPGLESAADVAAADDRLAELERRRGLPVGSVELTVALETAAGVWNVREIITASPRTRRVAIDEAALAAHLGIVQMPELDPFVYAKGRICIEATAAGVRPIAFIDPMGQGGAGLSDDDKVKIATDARNLGFKGMLCDRPHWVDAINTAFTPAESLVEYYTQVREVFAQALAAGTAAAPFAGRMIDVPVDEWAKDVLAMSAACAARDAEKQAALAQARE